MKYINLERKQFNCTGFNYLYSEWSSSAKIGSGRGCIVGEPTLFTVWEHKICDNPCALNGEECIYEKVDGGYFIYPVSELERTGQLSESLLNSAVYEIY